MVQFCSGTRDVFPFPRRPYLFWGYRVSSSVGAGALLKRAKLTSLTTHRHPVPKLKMSPSYSTTRTDTCRRAPEYCCTLATSSVIVTYLCFFNVWYSNLLFLVLHPFLSFGLFNHSLPCFSIHSHLTPILNLHFSNIPSDVILQS